MKRDPKLVINGYVVPGGVSRLAVAAAVDLIKAQPGVKQTEVLKRAVSFSGLNLSTASWITSPGRGPCGHLWDRRGTPYRCFPNEGTQQFNIDSFTAASTYMKAQLAADIDSLGTKLKPGDIVKLMSRSPYIPNRVHAERFLFISYAISAFGRTTVPVGQHCFTDPAYLDRRDLYGNGLPWISLHGISDGKVMQISASSIRAIPLSA